MVAQIKRDEEARKLQLSIMGSLGGALTQHQSAPNGQMHRRVPPSMLGEFSLTADNDDGDDYTDAYEISCGTDSLDAESVPSDFDGDDLCDALDDVDDTAGEGATETELGWTNAVPGFPALLAAIALVGAALVGRRKED